MVIQLIYDRSHKKAKVALLGGWLWTRKPLLVSPNLMPSVATNLNHFAVDQVSLSSLHTPHQGPPAGWATLISTILILKVLIPKARSFIRPTISPRSQNRVAHSAGAKSTTVGFCVVTGNQVIEKDLLRFYLSTQRWFLSIKHALSTILTFSRHTHLRHTPTAFWKTNGPLFFNDIIKANSSKKHLIFSNFVDIEETRDFQRNERLSKKHFAFFQSPITEKSPKKNLASLKFENIYSIVRSQLEFEKANHW